MEKAIKELVILQQMNTSAILPCTTVNSPERQNEDEDLVEICEQLKKAFLVPFLSPVRAAHMDEHELDIYSVLKA